MKINKPVLLMKFNKKMRMSVYFKKPGCESMKSESETKGKL